MAVMRKRTVKALSIGSTELESALMMRRSEAKRRNTRSTCAPLAKKRTAPRTAESVPDIGMLYQVR
eukprot:2309665-Rhodomonas_salina.6